MILKKAASFSLVLALVSVGALIFLSYSTANEPLNSKEPLQQPVKCSKQYNGNQTPLHWNVVSSNLFHLEV